MKTMKGAGYDVRESDPFAREQVFSPLAQGAAPIVGRIRTLSASLRDAAMQDSIRTLLAAEKPASSPR
jgi:hypothetical protein